MQIDFSQTGRRETGKILANMIVPKPVLVITTKSHTGCINAAPFSLVGIVSMYPPLIGISIGPTPKRGGAEKDTLVNIRSNSEMVVNLVGKEHIEKINITASDFPQNESEIDAAGFTLSQSTIVKPPGLVEAMGKLECRSADILEFGKNKTEETAFVIAEVLVAHIEDLFWLGDRPDSKCTGRLARLGDDLFGTVENYFEMQRIDYESITAKTNLPVTFGNNF